MKTRKVDEAGHRTRGSRGWASHFSWASIALGALFNASPIFAQSTCFSLQGSNTCPAFNQSSVSTDATLQGLFPFLQFVSDVNSFDTQLSQYIATSYSQLKYQQLLGCSDVNLSNTTNLYARYTATVICNAIVQNSIQACGLTGVATRPVCADTCAQFAISEEEIASTPALCGSTNDNALNQIRADFTNCALPADSLSGSCIHGVQNEPNNCGFDGNLGSLCSYCAASSPNATDSCCLFSNTTSRCQNVRLPITTAMGQLFPSTTSGSSSPAATGTGLPAASSITPTSGLSGGAIAGIVIGSILGALLFLAVIVFCCILARRRRDSRAPSVFNQPSPTRQGPPMTGSYAGSTRQGPDALPVGARVHQMAALEGSSSSPHGDHSSPLVGGAYNGSASGYDSTPESQRSQLAAAAIAKRGNSSRSGGSPKSDDEANSPEEYGSGQSEQLSHFKDYYSSDDIHANDAVSVLWAYQPRANDEWELERGDMIKVVGIWDDGWATGVKLSSRADEWEATRNGNRDSGLSTNSRTRSAEPEPTSDSEIKAFPLVCVCLPQHWRKTIEGDTMNAGESGPPSSP